MAGINQHTIPRFLLNGFANRTRESEAYVWVYRRGASAIKANTKKVAAERYFYGKPGELSVDDQITALEPQYATLLADLREVARTTHIADLRVPEMISHLSMRTGAFRQSMGDAVRFLLAEMHRYFTSEECLRKLLASRGLRDRLRTEIIAKGADPSIADQALTCIEPNLPEMLGRAVLESTPPAELWEEFLKSEFHKTIRNAHIRALADMRSNDRRAAAYARLAWFVVAVNSPVVLGDAACLFECRGKRRYKPVDDPDDEIVRIFLPISADHVVVGTPSALCPDVDVPRLNKATARCSYEYFVSSAELPPECSLPSSIGLWSGVLSQAELWSIIDEFKNMDLFAETDGQQPARPPAEDSH